MRTRTCWIPAVLALGFLLLSVAGAAEIRALDVLKRHALNGCSCAQGCGVLAPEATQNEIDEYTRGHGVGMRSNVTGRWNSTIKSGATSQGDPVVVTYSFVPDGVNIPSSGNNAAGTSNVQATLTSQLGSAAAWKSMFRRAFANWQQRSGVRYVEVPDDGAAWGANGSDGVRGEIRIFGIAMPGSIVAYCYYPGNGVGGDLLVDTSYGWSDAGTQNIILRNMVRHENGHGMGLGHVTSANANFLMEPVLSYSFDGAQDDDIRGMQRLYGDAYERRGYSGTGHNNSTATAADIGTLRTTVQLKDASINNAGDVDYYKFALSTADSVTVTVTPQGSSYALANQGSTETTIDTRRMQDLKFEILNASGASIKAVNATGLGSAENSTISLAAGTYYVKVDDATAAGDVQLYTLKIALASNANIAPVACAGLGHAARTGESIQFDGRNSYDPDGSVSSYSWDLNGDGTFGDSTSASPTFTFANAGSYTVKLRITDNGGAMNDDSIWISVTGTSQQPQPAGPTPYSGTPLAIPGTIQAENFDNGGEGVAYHDADSANQGGVFRITGVDLQACSEGGYDVAWTNAGEWLLYTVNVAAAGTYTLEARVSTVYSGKTFHVECKGADVSGPIAVPYTGNWQTWKSASIPVLLTAGQQTMRIVFDTGGFNVNYLKFTTGTTAMNVGVALPAKIEAENYNNYFDSTAGNTGGAYKSGGVDIQACTDAGGGHNVGWTTAGEWLAYNVFTITGGTFNFSLRVAATTASNQMHIEIDGVNVSGPLTVPNTGGWQTWANLLAPNIAVAAGDHVLKIVFDTGSTNFNFVSIAGSAGAEEIPLALGSILISPQPAAVGELTEFSAGAEGSGELNFVWSFGDGTSSQSPSAQHAYAVPGAYTARVTVMNSSGQSDSREVTVVVVARGTPQTSPFVIESLVAALKFGRENSDALHLKARILLPDEFSSVTVTVAGVAYSTVLVNGAGKFSGSAIGAVKARQDRLVLTITHAQLKAALAQFGASNATVQNSTVMVPVTISIGGQTFSTQFSGMYSAKLGRIGRIR